MDKYRVSVFNFDWYEGQRLLMISAFSINPLNSLDEVVEWLRKLDFKPDHIRINYNDASCLFDNEDSRIFNNVFYCNNYGTNSH